MISTQKIPYCVKVTDTDIMTGNGEGRPASKLYAISSNVA